MKCELISVCQGCPKHKNNPSRCLRNPKKPVFVARKQWACKNRIEGKI